MDRLSISYRIALGFGVVILFLVGTTAFSVWTSQGTANTFAGFREGSQQAIVMTDYLEDVIEAQGAVATYRFAATEVNAQEVYGHVDEILDSTAAETTFAALPDVLERLTALDERLVQFRAAFDEVLVLQAQRNEFVVAMTQQGEEKSAGLATLFENAIGKGSRPLAQALAAHKKHSCWPVSTQSVF